MQSKIVEDEALNLGSAAILCEHVANGTHILMAVRTEAARIEDSGWQFLCNQCADEDPAKAKIWLVREVLEVEPSLLDYLILPVGSTVVRKTVNSPWEVITRR